MSQEVWEEKDPKFYDFTVFLPSSTLSAIKDIKKDEPYERVVLGEIDFLNWATESASHGFEVFAVPPDSHVAWRLNSPLLESIKSGRPIHNDWVDRVLTYINNVGEDDHGMTISFNGRVAAFLSIIEQRVGLQSYDVLLNHGAFMFRSIASKASHGLFIVALNFEKDYFPWHSRYNARLGELQERRMIDQVSDWITEDVWDPAA